MKHHRAFPSADFQPQKRVSKSLRPDRQGCTKIALVTGASSGIGLATVRRLAATGWTVFAASRSIESRLDTLIPDPDTRSRIIPLLLDIQDEASCRQAVAQVMASGPLDALVHCAGAGIAGSVEEVPIDLAIWQFDNLFFGSLRILHAAMPSLRAQRYGQIVLVSSVAGLIPVPFQVHYSAAKAALHALALGLADEIRPFGISVTEIAPGDTRTGFTMARRMAPQRPDSAYHERATRSIARMARDEQNGMSPDAIAAVICRSLQRRWPDPLVIPGIGYQIMTLAARLLPLPLVRRLVRLLYA